MRTTLTVLSLLLTAGLASADDARSLLLLHANAQKQTRDRSEIRERPPAWTTAEPPAHLRDCPDCAEAPARRIEVMGSTSDATYYREYAAPAPRYNPMPAPARQAQSVQRPFENRLPVAYSMAQASIPMSAAPVAGRGATTRAREPARRSTIVAPLVGQHSTPYQAAPPPPPMPAWGGNSGRGYSPASQSAPYYSTSQYAASSPNSQYVPSSAGCSVGRG